MINFSSSSVVNFCELFGADLGMSGSSSVVERLLAKEKVASSNLVFRSNRNLVRKDLGVSKCIRATWPSG